MHRTPFQRAGGTVTAAAQSLANNTYLHFNDPKLEPCVWPDLYAGGVGGYKVGCGVGCAAYYRSRYLAFDERWRRDRWWSLYQVSKEMKNQLIWSQQNFKAQPGDRAEDINAEHLRAAKSSEGPSPLQSDPHHVTHNLLRNPLNHPVSQANQLHVQVPNHPHSPRANQANHQHAPHTNIRKPVLRTTMVLIP